MHASESAVGYESWLNNTGINSYSMNVQGNEVRNNFMNESAGALRPTCLLRLVLSVLRTVTVLVIDPTINTKVDL